MSIEFDSPANRIIQQLQPKNQFRIDTSLPDLAFLRQLSVQGRLRYDFGTSAGAGTLVTITPNVGETYFIYKIIASATTGDSATIIDVINDGMTRASFGVIAVGTGVIEVDYFDSLVGDGIKQITISNQANNARATALGWVENTSRIRDITS